MTATATALTEAEDLEETGDSARRGRGRTLVMVVAGVLLAVTVSWWLFLRGGDDGEAAEPQEGLVVEVAQMTVNLAGEDLHYVRFAFALVLAEDAVLADVEPRFALLKDAALTIGQSFPPDELRTPEGTGRFRDELTRQALATYPDGPVLRVVLTELLVQ